MPENEPAVFEFEGDEISEFYAQIPSTKLEGDVAYPRGTRIRMEVELRVSSVRHDENKKTGKLVRHHMLALEEARVLSAMTPAQLRALADAAEAQLQADAAAGVGEPYVVPEQPGPEEQPEAPEAAPEVVEVAETVDEPADEVDFSDVDEANEAKRIAGLSDEEVEAAAAEFEESDADQFAPAGAEPGF